MFRKMLIPLLVFGYVLGAQAGDYTMEAEPSKVFVGVQVSGAFAQGSHGKDLNYASKGFGYGVRVGAQNSEWRTLVSIDKMNNGEVSYERGELHAQYLFALPQLMDMGLRPFIGMNGGYANYEAKDGINESGFTYGGEAGVVFDLNEDIDIDLAYQYTIGKAKAFDHVGSIVLGVNYKY